MVAKDDSKKLERESEHAFARYQKARQEYRQWSEAGSREKWSRLIAAQKEDHEAFQKWLDALSRQV